MVETMIKVIGQASELFLKYGIRSVSMDDIARHLGISKKTLYQYVSNKHDLIEKALKGHLEEEKKTVHQIQEEATNAIDEMVGIGNHVYRMLGLYNPSLIYDLNKYYPKIWDLTEFHRKEYIYAVIKRNLEMGVAQGLYRSNLKPDLIARLYIAETLLIIDEGQIGDNKQYKASDIYLELLKYHIHGIASEEGIVYLKENLTKIKNNEYVTQL